MKRDEVLDTAKDLINGDRAKAYDTESSATGNFTRIAKLWGPIFGVDVTPTQVGLALVQLKVARAITAGNHPDSYIDMAGYSALTAEVAADAILDTEE